MPDARARGMPRRSPDLWLDLNASSVLYYTEGTSFPPSPQSGERVYRTDIRGGTLFRWWSSLARWLSEQEYMMGFGSGGPYGASFSYFQAIPHDYPIHLTRMDWSFYGSSESWSCKLQTGTFSEVYADVTDSTRSTASHTDAKWYGYSDVLSFAIDGTTGNSGTTPNTLAMACTRTSGTTYIYGQVSYRLSKAT